MPIIPDWLQQELAATPIPGWMRQEVSDYFVVPLDIAPPATVLDIGANIGAFAQRAHQEWPTARITCYEPMPFLVDHLRKNVSADWCEIVPCAVRAQAGEDDIFLGNNRNIFTTNSFRRDIPNRTDEVLRVCCVAAGELPACELVKIDTEGCEVEILQNLNLAKARAILLEFHSKADAATIKQMLTPVFSVLHDQPERDIGTMVLVRQRASEHAS
jgi:FkbM family methyltransferase